MNLGPHPPRLWPEDVDLVHEMWLEVSDQYAGSKLHHRDIVGVALRRMREELHSQERDEVVHDILEELSHRKDPNPQKSAAPDSGAPRARIRVVNVTGHVWYLFRLAMKQSKRFKLKLREFQMVLRGLVSTKHPLLAHIIPTRRCNLSCGYCNEYDDFSPPIPIEAMLRRIDLLAGLRTAAVTMSGGEPLLHPEVEAIIRRIRHHGMISGIITNGYLLTPQKIRALNDAGLDHLQISIDNIQPDDVSMKSLKVLDKKLEFLAEHAEFAVNINSVIGGGIRNPEDAITVTKRAVGFGFASSVGIIHDHTGGLKPLNERERRVYQEIKGFETTHGYSSINWFQENLSRGRGEQLEVPSRRSIPVYLRGRTCPLLFPATRASRNSVGELHGGGHRTRVLHEESLRASMHDRLRSKGLRRG